MKKITSFSTLLTLLLLAQTMQAQFLIGSPGETQLRTAPEWAAAKALHGDRFVRAGIVALNRADVNDQSIQTALLTQDLLSIRLFGDVTVTAQKTNLRTATSGGIYWTGTVGEGLPSNGELTLFMQNSYLTGTLRLEDKVFDIAPDENNTVKVVELALLNDPVYDEDCYHKEEPVEARFARPNVEATDQPELRAAASTDSEGHYIIDLLILYPTSVADQMGSSIAARTAKVTQYVEEANEIFANSEINIRFRLAHDEINNEIVENPTTSNQVKLNSIITMRDKYGADIVSHWNYNGSSGIGFNYGGDALASGYNTSNYNLVITQYTFVHECGHNIGAKHDRYDYRNSTDLTESPYYNFGKVFKTYRTVMAYANCTTVGGSSNSASSCRRIKYFSNPDVLYNDVPVGSPGETASTLIDGGPADNAKRLNNIAAAVSGCNEPVTTLPTFKLTVKNGTPTLSDVLAGTVVTITADPAPEGKEFEKWTSGDRGSIAGMLEDENQATTNVTMLSKDVSVQANYRIITGIKAPEFVTDAIVATKYYNLYGVEVVPETTGIYIVKNIHASGHVTTSKIAILKK
jgi:hypothetical protein